MADLTDSLVAVADAIGEILKVPALGLKDVFYGDQERIPRNPAACIETGEKRRELAGVPRRTEVELPVYILVYHNALRSGADGQRKANDTLAEAIETEIHKAANRDLGGLVIHGMVTALEPGYLQRGNSLYQVTRMTYTATSKVMLP